MQAAAVLVAVGMDGMALLAARDPVEVLSMQAVAERATKLVTRRDE